MRQLPGAHRVARDDARVESRGPTGGQVLARKVSHTGFAAYPAKTMRTEGMMSKFREKLVLVEAEQFFTDREPWPDGVEKMPNSRQWEHPFYIYVAHEGPTMLRHGDWIITRPYREHERLFSCCKSHPKRYACTPAVFAFTFEEVPDA